MRQIPARVRFAFDLAVVVVATGAFGLFVWILLQRSPAASPSVELPLPVDPVSLEGAWLKGNAGARVVVLEFSDFQCPACKAFFENALAEMTARYIDTGQILFAYRHFPLEAIHPRAMGAAQAANCAGRQGRFWEMHDALFQTDDLATVDFASLSGSIGAEQSEFSSCLAQSNPDDVRMQPEDAKAMGIRGTPAFLIGEALGDGRIRVRQRVSGAANFAAFEKALKGLL